VNYEVGYDLNQLRRQLGSKGVPMNPMDKPPFKKPFVHQKVAETIEIANSHGDIGRLLDAIAAL
jgi:putative ATP-dependent endonuclease of the OLD family